MKTIEFVCTGNRGRSPVAEILARNYLTTLGMDDTYVAASSGVAVQMAQSGNIPLSFQKSVVELALARDLFDKIDVNHYQTAVKKENAKVITSFYQKTIDIFGHEEESFREVTLKKLDILGEVKSSQEQTLANENTFALFGMTDKHKSQIADIYAPSSFLPEINNVAAYVYGPGNEVANAFGKSLQIYESVIEQLQDMVPKALENLLR